MLALSLPASADTVKPKNFPDCVKYKLADGTKVCGYTKLANWKKVLEADVEFTAKKKALELEKLHSMELSIQLLHVAGQIEAYKKIISIRDERNVALTKDLIETDRLLQTARIRPKWGSAFAWTAAAVAAAILVGYVLNDAL